LGIPGSGGAPDVSHQVILGWCSHVYTGVRGHATVLNVIYPDAWDPHIAGTIGPLAAFSPLYNQVVEFNPLNPSEILGELGTSLFYRTPIIKKSAPVFRPRSSWRSWW
jgi:hypothetical protein